MFGKRADIFAFLAGLQEPASFASVSREHMGRNSIVHTGPKSALESQICTAGEALDELISDFFGEENKAAGKETPKPSIFGNIQSTVQSLQRFAKQLSQ